MFEKWLWPGGVAALALSVFLLGWLWYKLRVRRSLGDQLRLTFAGVTIISLVLIVGGLIWQIRETLTRQTGESFVALATSNSQRLGVELAREIDLLQSLSEDDVFLNRIANTSEAELSLLPPADRADLLQARESKWPHDIETSLFNAIRINAASNELNDFQRNFPAHTQLIVTDRYGSLVAARGDIPDHYDYSHQPWWQETWQRGPLGNTYLGNPLIDADRGQTTIDIAFTIRAPHTAVPRGILRSRFNIHSLQLFADADPPGQGGELLLVDESRQILYSSNPARVGQKLSGPIGPAIGTDPLVGWDVNTDDEAQDIIQAYVSLIAPPNEPSLNNLNWIIIVQQPEAEALATVNRLSQLALVSGLLTLVVAIIVGSHLTRQLTRPLEELTGVALALGEGQLPPTAQISGPSEIRTLTQVFNKMAARLQQTLADLEQRIVDLARVNTDLTEQIAERRRVQKALHKSERKYRTLFEESKDAIVLTTLKGRVIDTNPACLNLFGFTRTEIMTIDVLDVYVNPDDRQKFLKKLEQQGAVENFETKFRRKDGRVIDCLITASIRYGTDDEEGPHIQSIVRDVTRRKRLEQERLRLTTIQRELTLAQEIQQSLLPPPKPGWSELDVACYSRSAHEVGGDLYAYHIIAPSNGTEQAGRYAIAVGDVSGKGISAALFMAISLASFQSAIGQHLSPSSLMTHLDQTIAPYTQKTGQNCALIYVEITASPHRDEKNQTKRMQVANAGCIMPLIRRAGGAVTWVEAFGLPLGSELNVEVGYQEFEALLSPGDLIILTSDGVVEAKSATKEIFSFNRLERAVATGPTTSAEAMLAHLRAEVNAFVGHADLHDDLTIVVVQV